MIIEALACGKPVISPNVGSISEMLEGNSYCLVYDEIDPLKIKEHIEKIARANPTLVRQACLKHFNEKFSFRTCVNAHTEAFNGCLIHNE